MEKKHSSSSKPSRERLDKMSKRQRGLTSDTSPTKSPLKIRKIMPETSTSKSNSFVDLTSDSDDIPKGSRPSIEVVGDKENSLKGNKASKNVCESEKNREENNMKIIKEEGKSDRLGRQDSAWIDELFSQFSDFEEDEDEGSSQTTKGSQGSQGMGLQTVDSGLQSLGATQPSNTNEKSEENSPKVINAGGKSVVGFHDDVDELFDDEWDLTSKFCLDLSDFTRCKIIGMERKGKCLHVTVADPNPESNATAVVICTGTWVDIKASVGESIVIKAQKSFGDWVVNNEWGYCITQPDVLISGTTVAGSLWCNRKAILEARFTGLNLLPNLEGTVGVSQPMTCGQIVHSILQKALRDKLYTLEEIKELAQKIIKEPSMVQTLYAADFTSEAIAEALDVYINKIYEFLQRYIEGKQPETPDNNFKGQIVAIRDIEENVWAPSLGLKGKIDVTVEVKVNNRRKIMPLEIKTGRTLFSNEHKGQLYLYVMMLKLFGYEVDSGLLLYIKDNQMQEINSSLHDQRGLISMRNLMAYHLSKPCVTVSNTGASEGQSTWEPMDLPEPIHHPTFCGMCAHNTVCCVYADLDKKLSLSDRHPLSAIIKPIMEELTEDHVNYIFKWLAMVEMEEARTQQVIAEDDVWTMKPEAREKRKTALTCLEISKVTVVDDMFHHEFLRSERKGEDFPVKDFRQVYHGDEYVMVSSDKRFHMASGFLVSSTKTSLVLPLDRDLTKNNEKHEIYVIDVLAIRSHLYRLLGTVATLLTPNDITRRMRRLIIDKEPARFTEPLPQGFKTPGVKQILLRLNKYQQLALVAVLKANDYVLIKGMPGTGKTETLVALIELLYLLGKSVIITAHTHNAVDNILLKLDQRNVDFMRLGSSHRLHPDLIHKSEGVLTRGCDTPEKLGMIYDRQRIVGVTCLGASHFLLSKRTFDYCVVDECTQVLQPVLLRPLYSASKFVFVGDPQQLPAVVQSLEARKLGMSEDIFNRLDSPNNTRVLRLQYRMNQTIMNLANDFTYKGELCVGNETVANATLKFERPGKVEQWEEWVQKALDTSLEKAVTVLNTGDTANMIAHMRLNNDSFFKVRQGDSVSGDNVNWYEIVLIQRLVNALVDGGISCEDIGVIAPFRAQINLLRAVIKQDVEINTVDQYQGRDKSVIVFSCTKSNRKALKVANPAEYRILEDPKRLNVAVTRAKHKIIIVGDVPMLLEYGIPTRELFSILKGNVMDLKDRIDGFSWDGLFKSLVESRSFSASQ